MKNLNSFTDEKLVDLVCKKDQEFYQEVVKRYQDKLLRYANFLVRDDHQAADVVQEAFIKAFINLRSFNTKKKFSSWIYRIVHNESINLLKKQKKIISLDNNSWLKQTLKSKQNIEKEFEVKEAKKILLNNLNKIPLKYKSVLVLYYLEDKSYEEVSDILRIAVGTVGTRINRGKKILKAIYEEKGGGKAYD